MGIFGTTTELEDEAKVPCFIGEYPFGLDKIAESGIVTNNKAISRGHKSAVYDLSKNALEIGYDAVHNIRMTVSSMGVTAFGDGIRLKK